MIKLELEYGRLSEQFNHYNEYLVSSVEATDTRLMGVVAMRIKWKSSYDSTAAFYQIIHLDYSEYGIDDYYEFECIKGEEGYTEKFDEMKYRWNHFVSVMGGSIVKIGIEQAIALIDSAVDVWKHSRLIQQGDYNESFRNGAIARIELMKAALNIAPYDGDSDTLIAAVSPKHLSYCETINYFLMRLVDRDFPAAAYLSTISYERLRSCELVQPGIQTLISNSIRSDKGGDEIAYSGTHSYNCKFMTLSDYNYYLGTARIFLSGGKPGKDRKVSALDIGVFQRLSSWESAMLVKRTEFITVYDIPDNMLAKFDYTKIIPLQNAEPQLVGNGWQFTIYNSNNTHVDSMNYHLNNDVLGSVLLTLPGELVVMTYSIVDIMMLENNIAVSEYAPFLMLKGRYQIDDMVFQSLCESTGAMFNDMITDGEE